MISPCIENWTSIEAKKSLKKFMKMKLLDNRLESFANSEYTGKQICMAIYDGLYLSDDKKFFVCFSCGLHIPTTLSDLNINHLHKTFNPDCAYLKREELGLKLWYDGNSGFSYYCVPKEMNFTFQENFIKLIKLERQSMNTVVKSVTTKTPHMLNPMKVYQLFQIRENRFYTFRNSGCPIEKANRFVESGFYYVGYGSIVQCAFCSLAFSGDNSRHPAFLHKFFYPDCPFLTLSKYKTEREYCCVCLVEPRKILYLPCQHLVTCPDCDHKLVQQNKMDCPLCRSSITLRINCISP